MDKKVAKPKRAPLKPRTAWAVVDNETGEIVHSPAEGHLYTFKTRPGALNYGYGGEHAERVRITKA